MVLEAKICESLNLIMGEEGGGKEERDGYEITNEEFYSKLKGGAGGNRQFV